MFCFAILQKQTLVRFVRAGISLAELDKLLNLNSIHFILELWQNKQKKQNTRIIELAFHAVTCIFTAL